MKKCESKGGDDDRPGASPRKTTRKGATAKRARMTLGVGTSTVSMKAKRKDPSVTSRQLRGLSFSVSEFSSTHLLGAIISTVRL